MTDSSLKLAINMHTKRVNQPVTTPNDEEEYQAFHFGRVGMKAQFTIGFRKSDGFSEGFAYADFRGWSTSDPNTSFDLMFVTRRVTVEGRKLARVLELIRQHRLTDLTEARHSEAMIVPDDEPIVFKLKLQ